MQPIRPVPPTDHRTPGQIHRDAEREYAAQLAEDRQHRYSFIPRCIKCGTSHGIDEIICRECRVKLNIFESANDK